MAKDFVSKVKRTLKMDCGFSIRKAGPRELYSAVSKVCRNELNRQWKEKKQGREVGYFSAEFLVGRLIYSNLMNMGLMEDFHSLCQKYEIDPNIFEEIEDNALGNGGLGRLAACFLDSAATIHVPLNGYGIRYRYGLFRQYFKDGFQMEEADDWLKDGDPWSERREDDRVLITFRNQQVYAVPYDMPVIGYDRLQINNLRLWQAEPVHEFDFGLFNEQKYRKAVQERDEAEAISMVLYPNDDTNAGKRLRLKQQYFFSSASIQDMIRTFREQGGDFNHFDDKYVIQLNDTHPVIAIPEFIRLMMEEEGMEFDAALNLTRRVFAYTNHTVMAEALEKWNVRLLKTVIPHVYPYIEMLSRALHRELEVKGIASEDFPAYDIISDKMIHMARMAVFASHSVNGVARIHTEILKKDVLKEWFALYPEKFNNKTNGITQRRWLALCNPELADFISKKIGKDWVWDLDKLKFMNAFTEHRDVIREFDRIKQIKKRQLADYVEKKEGIIIKPDFMFDVQVKRLHEYKRQLLNAFSILDFYFGIKDGRIKDFTPTVFLFGAKAAPGYYRAKGIIKYINEIAGFIAADEEISQLIQVVFVSNYDVSYAEKIMPAADVSEQISTAGTEASGTGNMKLMLNGAVTLGTYDGANIEIVEQAGEENNYIFGARVDDIEAIKESYDPMKYYEDNPRIKKVLDTLVDGTLDDGGTGMFQELYDAILKGASWHKPDHYYLLLDFLPYCDRKLKVNRDYKDRMGFRRKCYLNMVHAGKFSSDRTIREYAKDIWNV
ncbi:glycogen/starch/alpha-glucan phosphorylase [Anaerolentibacter hominis]|uniref:glycogen/starch/alpha-glucan phosphorylase n=1 Tax=Anaerolentibacter hominis TaxID=3079009 RepID=UPI0031B88862